MMTIIQAAKQLQEKKVSATELAKEYLANAKKHNPALNAYITICEDEALAMAHAADELIAQGKATALTGVPFGVKDAICTEGIRSTGAAKILDTYIPPYNATVIEKIRAQGGVIIGKQNCDTFGHGGSNENSQYGPAKNPWDVSKVPGGSSGGSAAALAAQTCVYSIAEDTGGSIRQPAAFCGVSGLRPSYGRNSRYGIMPMASSLDTVGPMAHTVEDLAIIMNVIAGQDGFDATTVSDPVPNYVQQIRKSSTGKPVIGLPQEYFDAGGLDTAVAALVQGAVETFTSLGYEIKSVSLPHTKYAIATYYIIVASEDSSNLARLDGIRYGVRAQEKTLARTYANSRSAGFPQEVKRRIMMGTYALSAGYYDAYYKKAQKVRTLIRQDFENALNDVDVLLAPVAPTPPFGLGEHTDDPLQMYLQDIFVVSSALAGIPGLALPCGFTKTGLPVGMQLLGPRMGESQLLQFGHHYQQHTDWHTQLPRL